VNEKNELFNFAGRLECRCQSHCESGVLRRSGKRIRTAEQVTREVLEIDARCGRVEPAVGDAEIRIAKRAN
jgi:hypothetical protein